MHKSFLHNLRFFSALQIFHVLSVLLNAPLMCDQLLNEIFKTVLLMLDKEKFTLLCCNS